MERWKPIPGYVGSYEASDLGRVRSLDRIDSSGRRRRGRLMNPHVMSNGYAAVTLSRAGVQTVTLVHRVVLMAFAGEPPAGTEGRHLNGDPLNNALSNLAWSTHSRNQLDQVVHGTHRNASKDKCPAGHAYDEANTYHSPTRPHRICRACRRDQWRAKQIRKAA